MFVVVVAKCFECEFREKEITVRSQIFILSVKPLLSQKIGFGF